MEIEGKQRNFGASKAKNDWVMMIDGDERMTDELKAEIEDTLANNDGKVVGYWIPRKNYMADHWLQYGGWYPGTHIKMYNKNYLTWKEDPSEVVHPGITMTKGYKGAKLTQNLIHYNFKNIEDYMTKVNRQTTLEALKWHLQGKKVTLTHALWKSFDRFCRRYIRKKGYRDGFYGLVASVLSGFYQFAAYSKYWEIKKKGMYINKEK
jgi:glycosyltransferase involved in cell wall biosynthesis